MSTSTSVIGSAPVPDPQAEADSTLHGRWLMFSRAIWIGTLALVCFIFLKGMPLRHFGALSGAADMLTAHPEWTYKLSATGLASYTLILDCLTMAIFLGVAVLIFIRKPNDRFSIFASFMLMLFGVTVNGTVYAVADAIPALKVPITLLSVCGVTCFITFLYIFPDGKFVPEATRKLLAANIVFWTAITIFGVVAGPQANIWNTPLIFIFHVAWFSTGLLAQRFRYACKMDPVQRQQTKWVLYGLTLAFAGFVIGNVGGLLVHQPGVPLNPYHMVLIAAFNMITVCLIPLSIGISMLHLRLWNIDPLIHRTAIYSVLTTVMIAVYFLEVTIFQGLFQLLMGEQSDIAIVVSTLLLASLFKPLFMWVQNAVDRRFYRERIDFMKAFYSFSHELRTIIDLPELLLALTQRINGLWHIRYAGVYLRDGDNFKLSQSCDIPPEIAAQPLPVSGEALNKLQLGSIAPGKTMQNQLLPNEQRGVCTPFALYVPLMAPRAGTRELIGVLALGPRLSGEAFLRQDHKLLTMLADQAGTSIYVAQLIQEKGEVEQRQRKAEEQLAEIWNSPLGRAFAFAEDMMKEPTLGLVRLQELFYKAGSDTESTTLLLNLTKAFDDIDAGGLFAGLAEGFIYLFKSSTTPELLPLGLRTILAHLDRPDAVSLVGRDFVMNTFRTAQASLEVSTIAQITQLKEVIDKVRPDLSQGHTAITPGSIDPAMNENMLRWQQELVTIANSLYAYERVDTPQDKLAYLVSTVERLGKLERSLRADLTNSERLILQRITARWLAIVTTAMSELQTRAQITCRLLTRNTWQDDMVSLALSLRNDGRGTAFSIRVALEASPEYAIVDEVVTVERLSSGEEVTVELRVRPQVQAGSNFRARFLLRYTDPRGTEQTERFADAVYLLTTVGEFKFIPNPYVVGTPLQTGSPLFFGREDVVQFIEESLEAAHRNNLVLIGQRRTGKTSLLKQLPARLGADHFTVYIDGQTLGLDPGLANFFMTLATEMTFALEDQGFSITPPEFSDFADSPASIFERKFLPRVREAIGDRHLVILFDEFEELEAAVRRGNLDSSVFGFLRHLIQHSEKLSVIFCGTHRMEELASDYWSVLFNISLYKHIGFLDQAEAMRLVQEPVESFGMRYDDLALDKIWRITAGHPYFLQLLCHSLVNRHNKMQRNYITIADVNAALEEILASGEAHFVYLWAESTADERLALTALSRMTPLTGYASTVQLVDFLAEHGVNANRKTISEALHRLALRDILQAGSESEPTLNDAYRWELGLLGLWVEKYKSLSRVIDEVRA